MGLEQFLRFIEEHCPGAYVPVDLLKITQAIGLRMPRRVVPNPLVPYNPQCFCLVIDGECCLDRLYGGYFNDWSCGGQWNRMLQFLHILLTTIRSNNIMIVVCFNGALEMGRFSEWSNHELDKRGKIKQIIRHVRHKGTPPPKILWIPPVGLRSALRMALRHFMVPVIQTINDHKQEVVSFLRDHDFDAIVAEGAEYAFFDPPRYFSAERLKLTFRGSLESRELILDEVAKLLNLHPNRFCLLAAMLGNHLVTAEELRGFYDELLASTSVENKDDYKVIVPAVVAFIRNLLTIDDVLAIGNFIFRTVEDEGARMEKARRFEKSVHYYLNGTKENYHKFFNPQVMRFATPSDAVTSADEQFASEATGGELHDVKAVPKPNLEKSDVSVLEEQMRQLSTQEDKNEASGGKTGARDGEGSMSSSSGSSVDDLSAASGAKPAGAGTSTAGATKTTVSTTPHSAAMNAARSELKVKEKQSEQPKATTRYQHLVPQVPGEVLRTNLQRHQKGLMHPWIHNVLSQAELKLECCIEEGTGMDFPPGWIVFRPIRQAVYAILFNLNHKNFLLRQQREGKAPPDGRLGQEPGKYPSDLSSRVFVKEWIYWSKHNMYQFPEYVPALALDWKGVPTVQRLWLGQNPDDKKKRMKAYLNCLASDSPLMLNSEHVPQHLVLLASVLRYMVAYPERRLLQRYELDAFLAQAVSPQLMDPNTVQDMTINSLGPRGVQLAQIFMQGIEHALFANDACGAPIPWVMCCPWLFFDGKLFQTKLDLAEKKRSLSDVCGGDAEQVKRVEKLRQAVLEGLEMVFNRPPPQQHMAWGLPMRPGGFFGGRGPGGFMGGPRMPFGPRGGPPRGPGGGPMRSGGPQVPVGFYGGSMGRRDLFSWGGGQLEVAGIVVGSWGGNVDKNKPQRGGPRFGPHGMNFGPRDGPGPQGMMRGGQIRNPFGGGPPGFPFGPGPRGPFHRGPFPGRDSIMFDPYYGAPHPPNLRDLAFGFLPFGYGGPPGQMRPYGGGPGRFGGGPGMHGRSRSAPRRRMNNGYDGYGGDTGSGGKAIMSQSATTEDIDDDSGDSAGGAGGQERSKSVDPSVATGGSGDDVKDGIPNGDEAVSNGDAV